MSLKIGDYVQICPNVPHDRDNPYTPWHKDMNHLCGTIHQIKNIIERPYGFQIQIEELEAFFHGLPIMSYWYLKDSWVIKVDGHAGNKIHQMNEIAAWNATEKNMIAKRDEIFRKMFAK